MEELPPNPPELKREKKAMCFECEEYLLIYEKKEMCPKCERFLCSKCAMYCFVNGVTMCWDCQEIHRAASPAHEFLKCPVCGHAGDAQCDCWIVYADCPQVSSFVMPKKEVE